MQRIIRVIYNPAVVTDGIVVQKHRDYFTNVDTLEEAIEAARIESQKLMDVINGEIVSIEEITGIKI